MASLFEQVVSLCAHQGMNLVGSVAAAEFDAAQPSCRRARSHLPDADTILLLGTGGRVGWEAVTAAHGGSLGQPRRGHHPIDDWGAAIGEQVLALLAQHGVEGCVIRPDDPHTLNFRQLAEAAGLGTISPVIGHLLHPVYGPWVSLRLALVLRGDPFEGRHPAPLADFDPCNTCRRPCVTACPAGVYSGARADLVRCGTHRVAGGCATGCASLRACPLGAEHRYGGEEEAWRQTYSMMRIRRWVGAGGWRWVPGWVRRRMC